MTIITVDLANRPYDIHVEAGLLGKIARFVGPYARDGRLLVITDENVGRPGLPKVEGALASADVGQ